MRRLDRNLQVELREVQDPQDPALDQFLHLLHRTFPDPRLISPPEQFARWVAQREQGPRRFHLLTARAGGQVVGGTMFSYIPGAGAALSELIAVDPQQQGSGLGRQLFESRLRVLQADAQAHGAPLQGLFIEVANPDRLTPAEYEQERASGTDPRDRRRIMAHLGYRQVEMAYLPPPFAPGQPPVTYLDLLFLPLNPDLAGRNRVPARLVLETLTPMWAALGSPDLDKHLDALRQQIGDRELRLIDVQGC